MIVRISISVLSSGTREKERERRRIDVVHDSDTFRSAAHVDAGISGGRTEDGSRRVVATNSPILVENIQDVRGGGGAGLLLGGLFARDKRAIVGESIRVVARRDAGRLLFQRVRRCPPGDEKPAKSISAVRNGRCCDDAR